MAWKLYVNAFSVPVICSPIPNQAVELAVKQYPHLSGLNLADNNSPSNDVDIDILIGADFYWNFVSNESRRVEQPGPVALLTRLGCVLSGPIDNYCEEVEVQPTLLQLMFYGLMLLQFKMYKTPT